MGTPWTTKLKRLTLWPWLIPGRQPRASGPVQHLRGQSRGSMGWEGVGTQDNGRPWVGPRLSLQVECGLWVPRTIMAESSSAMRRAHSCVMPRREERSSRVPGAETLIGAKGGGGRIWEEAKNQGRGAQQKAVRSHAVRKARRCGFPMAHMGNRPGVGAERASGPGHTQPKTDPHNSPERRVGPSPETRGCAGRWQHLSIW